MLSSVLPSVDPAAPCLLPVNMVSYFVIVGYNRLAAVDDAGDIWLSGLDAAGVDPNKTVLSFVIPVDDCFTASAAAVAP